MLGNRDDDAKLPTPQMPKDQLDFCPSLSNFVEGPGLCKLVASLLFCRPSPKPEDDCHFDKNHDDVNIMMMIELRAGPLDFKRQSVKESRP